MASPQPRALPASATLVAADTPVHARCGRLAGRLGIGIVAVVAASLTLAVLPGDAAAAPGGQVTEVTSPEQATQLVADATHELEVVTEEFNEAQETLAEQQAAAAAAGRAVADAQAQLAALDEQVRRVARSAFTGEHLSRLNALMSSGSADEFLSQVTTLDAIAGHTDDVLSRVTAAATAAAQAQSQAEAAAAAAAQTLQDVTARQRDLTSRVDDYQAQYDALSVVQQEEVVEAHAGPVLEAPAEVVATSTSAQVAVDTAMAQLGDPYVWAAGGPDAFDCSGLTQYAYAAAGVALPHSSRLQATMGTAVSRSALQPGDLVFFRSPVSHVGMYIGNGQMVHAATFGVPVQVTSVDMAGYAGARRILG
ncbi:C40 family peptidase [Modestobacter sp. VKM Ac-2983]|uniref:C40 family peptidase n=1 Tax=Modestobacter sp. VKM Ac-2983 TaxID=3004137 RepID=UPI0022AB86E5|nr:C40 family peptidase [Modestobacter sp. VKM Ac-2983]MCZ2807173.1 C40 family peptidase [Modestobacter sp. VKM Ac-2983]